MIRKTFHLLTGFTILLHSLLIQVPIHGFVLCIGEDGHFAIEKDHCQQKCPDHQLHEEPALMEEQDYIHHDHASDCLDIPIYSPVFKSSIIQRRTELSRVVSIAYTPVATENFYSSQTGRIEAEYSVSILKPPVAFRNLQLLI